MTIAVTAATGQLGRLVVASLKAKRPTSEIVALARHPAKAADLGVAVREADYSKPETLAKALAGVDTLVLISSSEIGQRAVQHRNVIEAAKKAGVKRIVYTSLLRADSTPLSLGEEHKATEAELRASGIPFTILRNGWYTENYTSAIGGALAGGAFVGTAGEGKISGAARADYAAAAVAALTGEGHAGKTYELAGDATLPLKDLAAEISARAARRSLQEPLCGGLRRRARRPRPAGGDRQGDRRLGRRRLEGRAVSRRPRAVEADRAPDDAALDHGRRSAQMRRSGTDASSGSGLAAPSLA